MELLEVQLTVRVQHAEGARQASVPLLKQPFLTKLRHEVIGGDDTFAALIQRVEQRAVDHILHELRVALDDLVARGVSLSLQLVVVAVARQPETTPTHTASVR